MYSLSEKQRAEHPQLKFIQKEVFESIFKSKIDNGELDLLKQSNEDLKIHLQKLFSNKKLSSQQKKRFWFCIVCRNPPLTDNQLAGLAKTFSIKIDSDIFGYAIKHNLGELPFALIELIPTQFFLKEIGKDAVNAMLRRAIVLSVENGHLHLLDKFIKLGKENGIAAKDWLAADKYYAFRYAAVNGHLAILEKL